MRIKSKEVRENGVEYIEYYLYSSYEKSNRKRGQITVEVINVRGKVIHRIRNSYIDKNLRGFGIGKKFYLNVIKRSKKIANYFESDGIYCISEDALKIWEFLLSKDKCYEYNARYRI